MAYIRKFERGVPFDSLDALSRWCLAGNYVFWGHRDRAWHGRAFLNHQFWTIARSLESGGVFRAAIRKEWAEQQKGRAA